MLHGSVSDDDRWQRTNTEICKFTMIRQLNKSLAVVAAGDLLGQGLGLALGVIAG